MWKCFHCDYEARTREEAVLHFGHEESCVTACLIDIGRYREMDRKYQRILYDLAGETAACHNDLYRMQADYEQRLIREEEKGYARGLRDAKQHPEVLGLQPVEAS